MDYDIASYVSLVIHYFLLWGSLIFILYKSYKNFFRLILSFYILFLIWGFLTYLFNGCPLTLFENWISGKIYNKPFYPDYNFKKTDFYYLINNSDFYIPFVLGFIILLIKHKFRHDSSSNYNDNGSNSHKEAE